MFVISNVYMQPSTKVEAIIQLSHKMFI